MRLLLDSQILYWLFHLPEKVQTKTRAVLADRVNELWFSAVTPWELAIKRAKGSLRFEDAALLGAIAEFRLHELQLGMGLPLPPCLRTIAIRSTGCWWVKPSSRTSRW